MAYDLSTGSGSMIQLIMIDYRFVCASTGLLGRVQLILLSVNY